MTKLLIFLEKVTVPCSVSSNTCKPDGSFDKWTKWVESKASPVYQALQPFASKSVIPPYSFILLVLYIYGTSTNERFSLIQVNYPQYKYRFYIGSQYQYNKGVDCGCFSGEPGAKHLWWTDPMCKLCLFAYAECLFCQP